jgi:hypothetical protein
MAPAAGSLAVLAVLWAILWAATNRLRLAGAILPLAGLVVGLANSAKLSVLDLPLVPLDIYSVHDLAVVFRWDFVTLGGGGKLVLLAGAAAVAGASAAFLPGPRGVAGAHRGGRASADLGARADPNPDGCPAGEGRLGGGRRLWRRRAARLGVGAAAIALLASLFSPRTNIFGLWSETFVRYNWDTRATFRANGLVVFLSLHCQYIRVEQPPGYSEDAVRRIVQELPPPAPPGPPERRPSVIVVLSESFCDPTRLPGVGFEAEPLPTFRGLERQFGRLDLISPVYAGLTCNAELEVLSGFNMIFFPQGAGAYVDYIRRPVPTLVSILRGGGYRTISLHAGDGIHNDTVIQPLLGFEKYVPGRDWPDARQVGWQVTDESATDEVLRWAHQTPRPFFLCLNTMEGHVPYDNEKYGGASCGIRFTGAVSERTREVLTAYTYGLHRADAALGRLIEGLRGGEGPLLIVFYGDHLPDLGENLLAYRETGYCPPGRSSECLPMRTVPLVIWNNCGLRLPPRPGPVSMCQMFPILLDLAGVPKPPHARLVEKVGQRWPVVSTAGCFDPAGQPLSPEAAAQEPLLRDYRLMQYDLLFGEQHFLRAGP